MKKKFFLHALFFLMLFFFASTAFATDFTGMTGTWKVVSVDNPGNETIPSVGDTNEVKVIQSGTSYRITIDDETKDYTVQDGKLVAEVFYTPGVLDRDEITYTAPNKAIITCHVNGVYNYTIISERVSSNVDENGHEEETSTQTDFTGMAGNWKVLSAIRYSYNVEDGTLKSQTTMSRPTAGYIGEIKVTKSGTSYTVTIDGDTETFTVSGDKLIKETFVSGSLVGREELIYTAPNNLTHNDYEYYQGNVSWCETVISERVTDSTETETPQTVEVKTGDITSLSTESQDALVTTIKKSGLTITSSKDIVLSSDTTVTQKTSYVAPSSSVTQTIETGNFKISTTALLPKVTINSTATNGSTLVWFSDSISTPAALRGKLVSAVKICLVEGILASLGSVSTANEGDVTNAVLLDANNQPVAGSIPDTIVLAANVDAGQTYDIYAATATASSSTTPDNNTQENNGNGASSSGSGCDLSGLGIFGLAAVLAAFKKK